ncbi:nucleolar complex protein 4 homolog A-like [Homarus americanus]|uniref:Nucleolar complex protein 4 A-like n=1 Tax=Homarus americanus TaxID=6706 RepID=A0A8J5J9T0_HOMAM|nr:nucleolar complex protein 4 homolog A-like [Homarus americanus]KAG7153633.1 Nucleolar complex protein 4 A-like [Homarus americanus]
MTDKTTKRTMKVLLKEFKADKVKNANVIVDIFGRLESNEAGTVTSAITGIHHIFTYLFNEEDIKLPPKGSGVTQTANDKFNLWLYGRYEETYKKILSLLGHEERSVRELSLCSLVKLIQSEGRHPVKKRPNATYHFPQHRLQLLLMKLVSDKVDHRHLITLLLEYMECQDFMFYTLLVLSTIVKIQKDKEITEKFMTNLFLLLEHINIPMEDAVSLDRPKLLFEADDVERLEERPMFTIPYDKAKKALNNIWSEVLKYSLTPDLYRRSLVLIPEKVMHHLDKPLILTDFFMESYNLGGAISLLALQGVFILVHKHNLEYPDFYTKLYTLLDPTVFHAKYKARFFMLCDRFLASSYLPEYIVAAFVKRLARLSLVAPTPSLVLILKFIANLLIRYPGLKKLIHKPNVKAMESDPYDMEEPDPAKCRASESSLWEVATLQCHVLPYVSKAAGFLNKSLPSVEYNISEFVETTYDEVFERACKVTVHENVATTFHKPQGLFNYHNDQMSQSWSVV